MNTNRFYQSSRLKKFYCLHTFAFICYVAPAISIVRMSKEDFIGLAVAIGWTFAYIVVIDVINSKFTDIYNFLDV